MVRKFQRVIAKCFVLALLLCFLLAALWTVFIEVGGNSPLWLIVSGSFVGGFVFLLAWVLKGDDDLRISRKSDE